MKPDIILHNSISLDGSLTNFEPNMELHYQIAGNYKPDAHLIGSNTIKSGIELFSNGVPPEESIDFKKPNRDNNIPYWIIPDTKGILKGLLHMNRRFEFCRDVIILTSEKTPRDYISYLEERNYDYYIVGKNHIDLEKSINLLSNEYNIKKILTDTGRILGNILLNQVYVSEISLLIHPVIVGDKSYNIFGNVNKVLDLKLHKKEFFDTGNIWVVYKKVL